MFGRPLFCHSSFVKYTSSFLQQQSRYETWLPNISEIAPLKLTGWIRPCPGYAYVQNIDGWEFRRL